MTTGEVLELFKSFSEVAEEMKAKRSVSHDEERATTSAAPSSTADEPEEGAQEEDVEGAAGKAGEDTEVEAEEDDE